MTEFVLVRHGETDWNIEGRLQGARDVPLNATGISQARAVATILAGESWDVVISSPLARAYDTAIQMVDTIGIAESDIVIDSRLKERNYGAAEGLDLAERESRFPDGVWPDVETHEMLDLRTQSVMEEFAKTHAGKRVVLVTHGGWIRSVLRVISSSDAEVSEIHIPNASCSWISHDGHAWQLGNLGVAEHLPIFD